MDSLFEIAVAVLISLVVLFFVVQAALFFGGIVVAAYGAIRGRSTPGAGDGYMSHDSAGMDGGGG